MGGKRRAAAQEVGPAHAAGAVAQPGRGRFAWASSAKSMALATEPESASNGPINRHLKTAVFILNRPSVILGRGLHNCFMTGIPAVLCVAQRAVNSLRYRDYLPNGRMNFGGVAALLP
jgi:hypothetical protein